MSAPRGGRGRGRGRGRGDYYTANDSQPQNQNQQPRQQAEPEGKNSTIELLKGFLQRRYDPSTKLLNFSAIATDEEVAKSGMFRQESTQKKFFPALMVVCDDMLETREAKEAAIESITLCGNNITNLNVVFDLCKTLNHIKNLDLSGNAFNSVNALKPWKGRFRKLEHLIIDPFSNIGWEEELTSWFPKLKILNGIQVRADKPAAGDASMVTDAPIAAEPTSTTGTPTPTPTLNSTFNQQQEEMIAYVQTATNLKRDYAVQCLEAGGWDLNRAGELFTQSQPTLPADAYN
jgi:nuclear RNA export factor